ncbi:MAG: hypothetical protein MJK04_03795, partial [Psychrosphaera sp.]|nr:hypothetical protein [Psychrosphaera sp.]
SKIKSKSKNDGFAQNAKSGIHFKGDVLIKQMNDYLFMMCINSLTLARNPPRLTHALNYQVFIRFS